ncbi:DUF4844 domain-containing protein [Sphingobium fuliginis]|jgi:hypothetical protein|uniref:DUF4844 domain-containing protein n=1 Tax=Sphingobium fuliginis (strain ATCC 27551) TaxID=336203 RepID=A0A7M2GFF1_SPHSA|nr:DUF4844 domain-containing protein [Sphingobium fuliginis]
MRTFLILIVIALFALIAAGWWRYSSLFPKPSQETVQLNLEKRHALIALRDERKFEPHNYPPLGYTGVATPEEGVIARAAVNDVIGSILSQENGPIPAARVSDLIGRSMKRVDELETEDRDRTADYMIEIWYLLGFKGATGRFAYGAAFQRPKGYAEPLPPGWKSATTPRPMGTQ